MAMKNKGIPILVSFIVFSLLVVLPAYGQDRGEEVYVIKKGDTLWDLSDTYLDDPFQWPELWQRNQYITNPHLIYPGNSLRLHGRPKSIRRQAVRETERAVGAVTEAQPISEAAKTTEIQEVVEESVVAAKEEESVAAKEKEEVPSPEEVEQALPSEEGEVAEVFRKGGVEYTILEEESLGRIIDAKYEKQLLAQGDTVYLALKRGAPEVGEKFMIFRKKRMLKNPFTRKKGKKIYVLGTLRITAVRGFLYQAEIIGSMDAVLRGDEIMTYRAIE